MAFFSHNQVDSWNGGYKESNLDCVGYSGAVAGVLDNTVIVLGGRETPGEDFNESSLVLLFDLSLEKNMTDYDVQGSLSRRIGHSVAVLHTKATLYVFGGKVISDDSLFHQCLDDMIKVTYSQRILRIEQMCRKGNDESPPARAWHTLTTIKYRPAPDAAAQKTKGQVSATVLPVENEEALLLMGGRAQGQQALKDIWVYTFIKAEESEVVAPKWLKLNTEGTSPLPLLHHSCEPICDGEKLIVFGGIKAGSSHYNESISVLDLTNGIGSWSTLVATSPLSLCFQEALTVQIPMISSTNSVFPQPNNEVLSSIDRILIFGGQNPQGHTDFTKFYLLDPSSGSTESFHGNLAIQSTMGHAVVSDEKKRKIYLFGGTNVDHSWRNSSSVIDLWQCQYEPAPDMSRFEKIRTFEYPNGDIYIGELDPDTDIRIGLGRCTFKDGRVYEGHWAEDKFDGAGVMAYANGNIYDGTWRLGLRDGTGKLTISPESAATMVYYDGQWQDDLRHGSGALGNRDGSIVRGIWNNDVFQVSSALVENFIDCGIVGMYEGEIDITTNLPSGYGRFESLNYPKSGEMYLGHWAQGKRDGEGMCMLFDGTIYQGEWKNGKKNGFGKCDFARTRDRYEGKWVGGQRCGQGKCTYAAGFIYEGHWAADQRHGQGRCTYTDGTLYEGQWKMDTFCGDGALVLHNE
ncbi:hypothetical protein THRCLA_03684 [Thraustotheca clavata]|uniref:Uncharacterized protein n=1 Tax=Thraustotheca clavata TaxID=74557 RepID=A0A1W0A190_9STRA|nr:hypothetical protein THRCLA_03684 [Thraustotheca clavata]